MPSTMFVAQFVGLEFRQGIERAGMTGTTLFLAFDCVFHSRPGADVYKRWPIRAGNSMVHVD